MIYLDEDFNKIAGSVLKKHRENKKYSLADLAKKINYKVSRQTLSKYELSIIRLKRDVFEEICKALEISPQEFLNEVNEILKNRK